MKITLEKKLKISKKLIVIPVFEENYIFEGLPKELNDFIKNLVKNKHFLTEKIKNFYTFEPFNIFLISLGKEPRNILTSYCLTTFTKDHKASKLGFL